MHPYSKGFSAGLKPDKRLLISEWADTYRILTTESSSEAGRWRTSRTPYLKEIMDVLSPQDPTEVVVAIKGTQLGFTEVGLNFMFAYMHLYPCPILMIQPTETLAKGTSKRRISPALKQIPSLMEKMKRGKAKEDIGDMFIKEYVGGSLTIGWSNSTASFRSFSARAVVMDDIDGFGGDFGEGDPIELGKARADSFSGRKIYINSTPTAEGKSLIEKEYANSDQREYHMPCPHCNHMITFEWENMTFSVKKTSNRLLVDGDVTYACPECGGTIKEHEKTKMMSVGEWIPTAPGSEIKGYRLPSFYSPVGWLPWKEIANEFLWSSKMMKGGNSEAMQVWQNTRNARVFKEVLETIQPNELADRAETYTSEVPDDVRILLCGVDTQDNRFEYVVLGFTQDDRMFYIDFGVIPGDPASEATQDELDDLLFDRTFERSDGSQMKIYASIIDTGGHRTAELYRYCNARAGRRVVGIKGGSNPSAPVITRLIITT